MSKVSVREAAQLTGKSRETINTATKEGKLSWSLDDRARKVIDVSELERVYPIVKSMDQVKQESETVRNSQVPSEISVSAELAVLREKLANSENLRNVLTTERERERRQLEAEIETLRTSLQKAQEQASKQMLLITDQSKQAKERAGDWETSLAEMKVKLANDTDARFKELQEKHDKEIRQLKGAVHQMRNRSLWKKLFS